MEIILHYELGKFDSMEYRIKSTYRFLASKQKMYQSEKIILTSIRKLISVNSKKESLHFFTELKNALEVVVKDPLEGKILMYFDIMSWLESKIENKTFAEVVKSKLKPLSV